VISELVESLNAHQSHRQSGNRGYSNGSIRSIINIEVADAIAFAVCAARNYKGFIRQISDIADRRVSFSLAIYR
jgi:hypothetical protein